MYGFKDLVDEIEIYVLEKPEKSIQDPLQPVASSA